MNFRFALIPSLALLIAVAAEAQTASQPVTGTPVTVQQAKAAAAANGYVVTQSQAGAVQVPDAAPSRQMPQDFRLLSGDLISIRIFGQPDYNPSVVVDKDGVVSLPFIGNVSVGGLTILQSSQLIADRLTQAGLYNHPEVTVNYVEGPGSTAAVVGEIHGVVPVFSQRSLLDVLTSLGGLPPSASHTITVNRPGTPQPIVVDLGPEPATSPNANLPIHAGDTIIVGRSGVVYVVGAFKNAGVFPLNGYTPTTLMQLAASTGGPMFEAKYDDLRLIRTVNGQRTLVKLDIKRVLYGKDPDPLLQSGDILFMPTSPMKALIADGALSTLLSVVSVAFSAVALSHN